MEKLSPGTLLENITVRVYGLLVHERHLLLSRENIKGSIYTKFPGGGLQLGEGVTDCIKREFREEAGIDLRDTRHFYTTENFYASAFDRTVQVLSIYYRVDSLQCREISTGDPDDLSLLRTAGSQVLYWWPLDQLRVSSVELPIDQLVVQKLMQTI